MATRRAFVHLIAALGLASTLSACANGDGRGFGTVRGTLRVTFDGDEFTTADGKAASVDRLTITVRALGLEAIEGTYDDGSAVTRTATVPIGSSFDPLDRDFALPFGPFEVDQGNFGELILWVGRVEIEGEVGDDGFTVVSTRKPTLEVRQAAALPINDSRPPNINLTVQLDLPDDLLEGLAPLAEEASSDLAQRVNAQARVDATWVRSED
ncbi:MAG: hypothetical protein IV100_06740 [Myxococcales bacterium]|nr:hypothetical protein [Myxococcales bacterium]